MLILGRHLKNQQTSFLRFLFPISHYSSSRFPSRSNFPSSSSLSPSDLVAKLLDGEGESNVTIPYKTQAPRASVKRMHEIKQRVPTSIDINHLLEVLARKDPNAVERAIELMRDPRFCMNIPAKSFLDGSVLRLLHVLLNEQRTMTAMAVLEAMIKYRDTFLVANVLTERPRFQFEKLYEGESGKNVNLQNDNKLPTDISNQGLQPPEALIKRIASKLGNRTLASTPVGLKLALLCFGRSKIKQSKEYRILESIEGFFAMVKSHKGPKIRTLEDAFIVLDAYDFVGRRHDQILNQVNDCLSSWPIRDIPKERFANILRSNARLHIVHRNSDNVVKQRQILYAQLAIKECTEGDFTFSKLKNIGKVMWSVACMGIINDIDHFVVGPYKSMSPLELIQYSYDHWKKHDKHFSQSGEKFPSFILQLFIAVAEIMTNIEDNKLQLQLISKYSIINMAKEYRTIIDNKTGKTSSSWFHQDASKVLTRHGISHENEKQLEYGYIADIFVSPLNFPSLLKLELNWDKGCYFSETKPKSVERGLIIEINGPSHYETYLGRELGHTAQKRRHLEALGYNVANISYRTYDYGTMTKEEKFRVILNSIFESRV